jgi:hypothetical protein
MRGLAAHDAGRRGTGTADMLNACAFCRAVAADVVRDLVAARARVCFCDGCRDGRGDARRDPSVAHDLMLPRWDGARRTWTVYGRVVDSYAAALDQIDRVKALDPDPVVESLVAYLEDVVRPALAANAAARAWAPTIRSPLLHARSDAQRQAASLRRSNLKGAAKRGRSLLPGRPSDGGYDDVQLTLPLGTDPSEVGGSKVQDTVRTTVPTGCSTTSVALVNATSSIDSVQFEFGQSGAPAMVAGADVVRTPNGVVPFLISEAGIFSVPVNVIGAGFCPGAALVPLFVHVEVTLPVAVNVITTSALPRPDSAPEALR